MSMKRSPEWLADYERRIQRWKVKGSTSGGVDGHASHGQKIERDSTGCAASAGPAHAKSESRCSIAGRHGKTGKGLSAGIESGPLTNIEFIAEGATRKDAPAPSRRLAGAAVTSAPVYPVVSLCRAAGLPEPVPEYQFHPSRKWRADYAWPTYKLMLEVDGGVWTQGRHTRGSGRIADMEKQSEAAILGWRILYVTPEQVSNGAALDYVQRALRPLEFVA